MKKYPLLLDQAQASALYSIVECYGATLHGELEAAEDATIASLVLDERNEYVRQIMRLIESTFGGADE